MEFRRDRGRRKKLTGALIWSLDWGEAAEKIKQAAALDDGELPPLPFLESQVDLEPHLQFEWQAFRDLSTDRQAGFGVGPIPWTSIDQYAARHGVEGDEFERFCHLVRAMDDAYRAHIESLTPKPGLK
jgi:hypothetical protein